MYIHRELEQVIEPYLTRREVLAIVGPRQAGKTTFLEHLKDQLEASGKSVKFLTFETRSDLALFQDATEDFRDLCRGYAVVIIDEFQYAKEGGQKLKYLFDTSKTKYIVSGSSSLELTFQTGKFMVGRMLTFTLWPFSFRELLSYIDPDLFQILTHRMPRPDLLRLQSWSPFSEEVNKRLEHHFERYLLWGGYPAVVRTPRSAEKQKLLEGIVDTYLLRDIRSTLQLATEDKLLRLIQFLSTQLGGMVVYKELSNVAGLHHTVLLRHLEILRQTYIIDMLKPFFTNRRTELTKNPKVYFLDSGLRNVAIDNFQTFEKRADRGALVENYVAGVLLRTAGRLQRVHFWRTKSGAEVDFVRVTKSGAVPIEVKYSAQPTLGKSFYSFIEKFAPQRAIIITRMTSATRTIRGCRVHFVPAYYL